MARRSTMTILVAATLAAAAALILVGRWTVGSAPAPKAAHKVDQSDDYFDGLQVGEAQGRREGRAIQEGAELPAASRRPVHDAFDAGYAAGLNDAFAGYDGGWAIGLPYVVVIANGTGQVAYRIKTREALEPRMNYFLCPNGRDLCEEPRH
jgi:hypothetical protein